MKHRIGRRQLLGEIAKGAAGIYGLQLLSPFQIPAHADGPTPYFFLLISVEGSMDVSLGLDGQVHAEGIDQQDIFIEYRPQDLLRHGTIALGPAAAPLKKWMKQACIINGINMRADVGHETLRNYMASGKGDGTANSLPIELGTALGVGPMGVVSSVTDFASRTSQVAVISPNDLKANSEGSVNLSNQVRGLHSQSFSFAAISGLLNAADRRKQFASDLKSFEGPKIVAPTGDSANDTTQEMEAAKIIALAFKNGLSYQGTLIIDRDPALDTHQNHEKRHLETQKQVWQEISDIFSLFSSIPFGTKSLFDVTTFMVTTEFSRTPYLNGSKGKDHNPFTNSVLLAGRGIQGGTAVGRSQVISRKVTGNAIHIGDALDFKTGEALARDNKRNDSQLVEVDLIRPEHVARTVARLFNDPMGMGGLNYKGRIIPGVIKA